MEEQNITTSSEEDWDPAQVERVQNWAMARLQRPVLRRYHQPRAQRQNLVPDPLGPQRQQLAGLTQTLTATQTVKGQQFVRATQDIPRRMQDNAATTLQGRANTLATEEKDLKKSTAFTKLMSELKEYEALAAQSGTAYLKLKGKRDVLKKAAEEVVAHFQQEHPKDLTKSKSDHARGFAAAQQIVQDITAAENERSEGLQTLHDLVDDFKGQIAQRQQGGAAIDRPAMAVLENLRARGGIPTEIDTQLSNLLVQARQIEGDAVLAAIGNPPPGLRKEAFTARAAVCLELGGCKPPSGSDAGASDSFFLKDHRGNPAFVFKPMEGEADQSGRGWEKGGAAPRELLASALNDQLSAAGLNCNLSKAALVKLDHPAVRTGNNATAQQRTGAMIEFAPNNGNLTKLLGQPNSSTPDEELGEYCDDKVELARRKQRINQKDLQKIAIFDFVTLNLDRNPANMLVKKVGDPPNEDIRLLPIDGGNLLPCREALEQGKDGLAPALKEAGDSLGETSALMQLPQASQDFDQEMIAHIDALDPQALSDGMRNAYTQIGNEAPAMKGKVKPEVFDMMKLSTMLLKRGCGSQANPRLTPADVAEMYHQELTGFFDHVLGPDNPPNNGPQFVPPNDQAIAAEMDRLIQGQVVRKQQAAARAQVIAEIKTLGGQPALVDLGWPKSLFETDPDQTLDILRKRTEEPGSVRDYLAAGGDLTLKGFDPGADFSLPAYKKIFLLEKLQLQQQYDQAGGDDLLKQLAERFVKVYESEKQKWLPILKQWEAARNQVPSGPARTDWLKTNKKPEIGLPIYETGLDPVAVLKGDLLGRQRALTSLRQYFNV